MEKISKKYSNNEITIIWKPKLCVHAAICFRELPDVFKPGARPWINPNGATTEELIKTIKRCPTKALDYVLNSEISETKSNENASSVIRVINDGPFILEGNFILKDENGNEIVIEKNVALCRCGASTNKPFCDGKHRNINYKD